MPPKTTQEIIDEATRAAQTASTVSGVSAGGYKPITSGQLAPASPIAFKTTQELPVPDISGLLPQIEATNKLSQEEQGAQDISTRLMELTKASAGKSGDILRAEEQAGLPAFQTQEKDLTAQLTALINENAAIPLQIQQEFAGKGATAGGVAPIQAARLRENAIKALSVNSLLQAVQGNLASARAAADRSIELKYAPVEDEIKALQTNLNILQKSPAYMLAGEKRDTERKIILDERARILQENIDERKRVLETQKETDRGIQEIAMKLAQYGADSSIIQGAKSINEAIMKAGTLLQDPQAKLELQSIKLNMELARQKILTEQKQRSLLGEPTPETKKAEKQLLATAKGQVDILTEKVNLIDGILGSGGMSSRVGTNFLSRTPVGEGFLGKVKQGVQSIIKAPFTIGIGTFADISQSITGEAQQFAGGVHKLASKEFLDALIDAKAKGATFGALTDREGDALRASATQLNDWEIKDSKGLGTGVWNIDEASFKGELENIKKLANQAILKSKGTLLTPEEQAIINANSINIPSASDYFQ